MSIKKTIDEATKKIERPYGEKQDQYYFAVEKTMEISIKIERYHIMLMRIPKEADPYFKSLVRMVCIRIKELESELDYFTRFALECFQNAVKFYKSKEKE